MRHSALAFVTVSGPNRDHDRTSDMACQSFLSSATVRRTFFRCERAQERMTKIGTREVDRVTAFKLAVRNVGRLMNINGGGFIGFTKHETKRRDVASLIGGQPTEEVCTEGKPFWFQARIWFEVGDAITKAELLKFAKKDSRREVDQQE